MVNDAPRPLSEKEVKRLERQWPGVGRLLNFFAEAGIHMKVDDAKRLWVSGKDAGPLSKLANSAGTATWNSVIDEIAYKYSHKQFVLAVTHSARFGSGVRTMTLHADNGFVIMRGRVRLAVIRATRADVSHRVIMGNFLTRGHHWHRLAKAIRESDPKLAAEWAAREAAEADRKNGRTITARARRVARTEAMAAFHAAAVAEAEERAAARAAARAEAWARASELAKKTGAQKSAIPTEQTTAVLGGTHVPGTHAARDTTTEPRAIPAQRRIETLPADLAPHLIGLCMDASRRIRLERQVAYDRPVTLECLSGELTLMPVRRTETRMLLPFRFKNASREIKGELLLGGRDPIPILIGADVAESDAIAAWTCALVGFADATCVAIEMAGPTGRSTPRPQRRSRRSSPQARSSIPAFPRRRQWPSHLEPVGSWVNYSGALVAGHRRHLQDGQRATVEARYRALQVGISLQPGETWVRPHTRGVPDGVEMRFRWKAPDELLRPV